jgi:parallel beta-helix repeat protein
VPCGCGDTVTQSTTLTADVGTCDGVGLRVLSRVALDCANHAILGTGLSTAHYGVLVDTAAGAAVANCRISGFRRGIRVFAGHKNRISGNETFANDSYGIELAGGSRGNRVVGNNVHDNRDEGIHVGAGAHETDVLDNVVTNNKNENIYVLSANGCRVVGNTATRTDSAAIFLKHAYGTHVARNTVVNGPIHVRGDSSANVFVDNDLRGNGYFFEAYQDDAGMWTYPRDNTVTGGQVENTTTCLRFAGSYDNRVDALRLDNECQVLMWSLGGQDPTGNVIDTLPLP